MVYFNKTIIGSLVQRRYSVRNVTVAGHNTKLKDRLTVERMLSSGQEWKQDVGKRMGGTYG